MVTSFTRVVIVLSFLRRALGVQDLPPNAVVMGLSVILTFLVMTPVVSAVKRDALDPYTAKQIERTEALSRAEGHLREFMLKHAREQDIAMMMNATKQPEKAEGWAEADVPTHVLVPSFALSELRRAFVMGFALFLPFLVIDLVVASILAAMGLVMLPPVLVSLPFKLLLFVLVDGWALVVGSLVASFN
jgi:flagellar biosynthetic protein FliP